MKILAISYCTPDYGDYGDRLAKSAQKHGVVLYINRMAFNCTWQEAVRKKPRQIWDALESIRAGLYGHDVGGILFTDADSEFKQPPPWKDVVPYDVAYHEFQRTPSHPVEALTGTMWFSSSVGARQFVASWCQETLNLSAKGKSQTPEQDTFKKTLANADDYGVEIGKLKPEWCWIYDDFVTRYGERAPIVEHYQASRKMKRVKRAREKGAAVKP